MKYLGSKRKIAKDIIKIMLDSESKNFYDIFCGGGNLIQYVPDYLNRIAVDNDCYVIEALKAIRDFPYFLPKELTKEEYLDIRNNKEKYPKWLVGYVGYNLSWGGKWFGGFRKPTETRNYVLEAYNSAIKQSILIQKVNFICADYAEIQFLDNSIIYFDPPYYGTTKYKTKFDFDRFYSWLQNKKGYLSEYSSKMLDKYNIKYDIVYEKKIKILNGAVRKEILFKIN